MNKTQVANWLDSQKAQYKRAIAAQQNPLIKEIIEKDMRELEAAQAELRTTK